MTTDQFDKLLAIVKKLRDPNGGCPWDLEQTHESLKPYLIEEAYEVIEAIDRNPSKLHDELGDVLLQVVLHSQIASERKAFTIDDVIKSVSEKMVRRHPHVFGDKTAKDSQAVLKNWERQKQSELVGTESILDGVPRALPALHRAQRIGEKAARVGFEWPTTEGVRDKVFEEVREFLECSCDPKSDKAKLEEEFGDILFALTQLARRLNMQGEDLLTKATDKFVRRFKSMESKATKPLAEMSIDELDAIWEAVKATES